MNKELEKIRDEMAEKRVECICAFEREEYINTFKDGFNAGVNTLIKMYGNPIENATFVDSEILTIKKLESKCQRYEKALKTIRRLVDGQAEDEGLWFIAEYASEAYIQKELRRLHGLIEHECDALKEFKDE